MLLIKLKSNSNSLLDVGKRRKEGKKEKRKEGKKERKKEKQIQFRHDPISS